MLERSIIGIFDFDASTLLIHLNRVIEYGRKQTASGICVTCYSTSFVLAEDRVYVCT